MFTERSPTKAAARDTTPLQSRARPRFLCELPHPRHTVPIHSTPPQTSPILKLCSVLLAPHPHPLLRPQSPFDSAPSDLRPPG